MYSAAGVAVQSTFDRSYLYGRDILEPSSITCVACLLRRVRWRGYLCFLYRGYLLRLTENLLFGFRDPIDYTSIEFRETMCVQMSCMANRLGSHTRIGRYQFRLLPGADIATGTEDFTFE
ncbi:hypothetical protein GE21DRAFT_1036935 [Neurospora crassa]|nr:hypothetical protein 8D4.190 [imported] - Neurospora crassa [Neurospora crassa]KHE87786.1 hypothetical protein GE21DRAFT_1036935 [Neurospora crassa]